jgi:hypothetical protein
VTLSITPPLPAVDVKYYFNRPVGLADYVVRPVSRAKLDAVLAGRPGVWPGHVDALDRVEAAWHAIAEIDKRQRDDGTLSDADQLERDTREKPIAGWLRSVGLFPVGAA